MIPSMESPSAPQPGNRSLRRVVITIVLLGLLAAAWSLFYLAQHSAPVTTPPKLNLLLITLDTTPPLTISAATATPPRIRPTSIDLPPRELASPGAIPALRLPSRPMPAS